MSASMANSNLRRLRLGEEKKKIEGKKKPQGKNIMACPIPYGGHNNNHILYYEVGRRSRLLDTSFERLLILHEA